jgi:phage terminase large subunit-like protein
VTRRYNKSKKVSRLTADAVRSFSEVFLQANYDGAKDSPPVHDEWWEMCCHYHPRVAIAAPRGHAKTTAITLGYGMASVCLRYKKFVIIVGDTEDTANDFLAGMRDAFRNNEELRAVFGIHSLEVDGATNCIIKFKDGGRARIMTRGAGQKVRGKLWDGTRPDLILIDDLENDEAVESQERRAKLKNWLLNALFPCVSKERGEIRMVGTILHNGSALSSLLESKAWKTKLYKAHEGYDDFTNLLWPEHWTEEALKATRQIYIDMGNPEGYSQEYLNDPSDIQNPFFREEDFIPMTEDDKASAKVYYVGCDFALSDKSYSDKTVFTVGGYDSEGVLHIVDERAIKTSDTAELINELFSIMGRWNPDMYIFEGGVIANAIEPAFKVEMRKRNKWSNIHTYTPIQDKRLRAASIQQRMRSGGCRHDTEASWYPDHEHELRKFPRGKYKDRVDAVAWLGRAIDEFIEAPSEGEMADDDWEEAYRDTEVITYQQGMTGY